MKMIFHLLAVITFITACDKNPEPITLPDLTDIDGNEYDTVKISSQFWMQQNLKTSHYRNGDPIPEITSMILWSSLTSGAWCWYNNDSVTYAAIYGKLYNWYAVNDPRGLAPKGWHVPSDIELATLSMSLGGDLVSGGEMKETGTKHWKSSNTGATNSSGFTGLPGGYCDFDGTFYYIGEQGLWWSSAAKGADQAWLFYLDYRFSEFKKTYGTMIFGFSVRCLKD